MSRRDLPPDVVHLAAALAPRVAETADRITRMITSEIPSYRAGVIAESAVHEAVRSNLELMIEALRRPGPADLAAARQTGLLRGRVGAPLPELLRAYRIGFAEFWRLLVEEARRSGAIAYDALIDVATEIWELADDYSMAVTDAYREADSGRVIASAKQRAALVDAVLTGGLTDHDTQWEIAERLRLPHTGVFLVVAAEASIIGEDPMPDAEMRLAAKDIASGWRLMPELAAGVLSCGSAARLETAVGTVSDMARTRVGLSPPFHDLRHAPDNLRYARTAMGSLPAGAARARQFSATPLGVLAASSPEAARSVARDVLGPILALPVGDRDSYLATVQAWLDARGSAADAGAALFLHANTVRHRIRRIEELAAVDLADPNDVANVAAALQAIQLFPDLVT